MNLSELVRLVAQDLRIPQRPVRIVAERRLRGIVQAVEEGNEVRIVGFGHWSRAYRRLGNLPFYRERGVTLSSGRTTFARSVRFRWADGVRRRLSSLVDHGQEDRASNDTDETRAT